MSYGRIFGAFYLAPIISDALKTSFKVGESLRFLGGDPDRARTDDPSVTGWCSNQLSYRAILEQLLLLRYGAADEARTRYLHLGKVALYQMSYGRILETLLGFLDWCLRSESNQ